MSNPQIKIMGVRHHGPGSARSVLDSLTSFAPDCLLVEGPPEGNQLIKYVRAEGLAPPVALLVYAQEHPRQACYYPFAEFSPEWQALNYAVKKSITCRFMDLPQTHWLALSVKKLEKLKELSLTGQDTPGSPVEVEAGAAAGKQGQNKQSDSTTGATSETEEPLSSATKDDDDFNAAPSRRQSLAPDEAAKELSLKQQIRLDPIGALARSAGFSDGERWWEQLVEQRSTGGEIFEGINEAMAELRRELIEPERILLIEREDESACDEELYKDLDDRIDPLREAHMRQTLRQAIKDGFQKIAIICGAWHGPAFTSMPPAKNDAQLLKGLPKIKVEATWIPWTHGRLQYTSGYGAGVQSPGWYQHMFNQKLSKMGSTAGSYGLSWLVKVAHLLRSEDLDASSAQVIDAFRLAEALAAMRDLANPGLDELNESTVTALCGGNLTPLSLIYKKLVVGERLGEVPAEIPGTPLQRDLTREQTRLRLKPEPASKTIELDLRKAFDLEKSELLHRLLILDIHWGEKQDLRSKTSTFHEQWEIEWQPELSIAVVEAGIWGRSIEEAAVARAIDQSKNLASFSALVRLLELTMDARLPQALPAVVTRVDNEAATLADITELLKALPTLARMVRYGNVRGNDGWHIRSMIDALVTRICINLPAACSSLDDDAAALLDRLLADGYAAVKLLDQKQHIDAFHSTLAKLSSQQGLHGQIAGRATRLLFDCTYFGSEATFTLMNHALGHATTASYAGQWLMGFLSGSGLVLIHDHRLFQLVDLWLSKMDGEHFIETLPLLRRTFGGFTTSERTAIGEMARNQGGREPSKLTEAEDALSLNEERVRPVLATLRQIFGLPPAREGESKTAREGESEAAMVGESKAARVGESKATGEGEP